MRELTPSPPMLIRNKQVVNISNKISNVILKVAKSEDSTLSSLVKEGIFHMPELAFSYECGKAIMSESQSIFGSNIPKWVREKDLGNGGPTDLLFEFKDGKRIAIEFKLRDTCHAYIKDIEKLFNLKDKKTLRLFCALIDVFENKLPDDGRQSAIERLDKYQVTIINKEKFPTKQNWYTSPVYCVAAVWSVGNIPDIKT